MEITQNLKNQLNGLTGRDFNREKVRIRDNYTCQKCFKVWQKGKRRFDVHHLNGLCGKKSRGYDKEKDFNGLITYCHRCHLNLHSIKKRMSNVRISWHQKQSPFRMAKILKLKKKIPILYKQGLSLREIGKITNRSYEWVRQALIELKVVDNLNNKS